MFAEHNTCSITEKRLEKPSGHGQSNLHFSSQVKCSKTTARATGTQRCFYTCSCNESSLVPSHDFINSSHKGGFLFSLYKEENGSLAIQLSSHRLGWLTSMPKACQELCEKRERGRDPIDAAAMCGLALMWSNLRDRSHSSGISTTSQLKALCRTRETETCSNTACPVFTALSLQQ